MERVTRKQQEIMREMEADIRAIEGRFCENLLTAMLRRMQTELGNEEIDLYLAEVKNHVLGNLDDFKEAPPMTLCHAVWTGVVIHSPITPGAHSGGGNDDRNQK